MIQLLSTQHFKPWVVQSQVNGVHSRASTATSKLEQYLQTVLTKILYEVIIECMGVLQTF